MDNDTTELIFEVAYFNPDQRRRTNASAIERALHQVEGLTLKSNPSADEKIFAYFNPDTQVACRFVIFPTTAEDEADRVGLAFEMDLPRATSFALETLPLVVQVARELRLEAAVISPDFGDAPAQPTMESLLTRWQEANVDEIAYQEEEGAEIYRFKGVDLEALWEYMLLRRELNRRGSRGGVEMAEATMWGNPKTLEAVRCSDWTKLNPIAFPDVDWVRLLYPPAPLKHGKIYRMDELRQVLKFRENAQPIAHLLYEGSHRTNAATQIGQLTPVNSNGWKPISFDRVVDEHPLFSDLE